MTTPTDDPRVWAKITGLPVTGVKVIPGGPVEEGYTIDGQQVFKGDEYRLTIGDADDSPSDNGIYTVSSVAPQFGGITGPIFRFGLRHEWWARILDRVADWYVPRWQRWRKR